MDKIDTLRELISEVQIEIKESSVQAKYLIEELKELKEELKQNNAKTEEMYKIYQATKWLASIVVATTALIATIVSIFKK